MAGESEEQPPEGYEWVYEDRSHVQAYSRKAWLDAWILRFQVTPFDQDWEAFRAVYEHCPVGHKVGYKVPLEQGGLNTADNMTYVPLAPSRRKRKLKPS